MTKRIFAAVIAIAMVCTMFAFASSAAETTTVNLDSSVTAHGWNQILNAINFNDFDHNEDGWGQVAEAQNLRAILLYGTTLDGWAVNTEEPWNSVLYLKCKVADLITAGIAWNGETPAADVLVCDYMQNTFGYVAYALRGGKQRAVDLWNSYCSEPVALDGDNAFTYTNNTTYTDESFNAALACLKAYMTYAQDNQVCNVGTAGRWTAQKARYDALETALQGLVEGAPTTPDTPPETPTETTVTLAAGSNYSWYGYLNVVNVIPDTETEGLRADGTPYNVFFTELLAIMNDPNAGAASDAAYMNSYAMSDGTLLKDYAQDTYGAYAYVLRGGRQKAADYWNSKLSVALTLGNNSYTYTNAGAQDAYDATAYQAAVDALVAYMTNTADASCFDVANGGGRFFDQRSKYEALVAAVDACAATAVQTLVDFTGVTTSDGTLTYLITMYNNVDVESIKADADVQNWAKAIKDGIAEGKAANDIFVGSTDVVTLWENLIRYTILLNAGARTAADNVMNDASLWPLGSAVIDQAQTTYKAAQYQEVYDLWVQIRDEYRSSTTIKTSEVIAACDTLKAKIQTLEVASLPFTTEQKQAVQVLETFVPYYRARVNRIVLETNKATSMYTEYVALVEEAEGYIALDWTNGTSESYPSVETMENLILPDAMGGLLETNWYPFRLAFGLDTQGYDAVIAAAVAEWEASGLYSDASIAAVKEAVAKYEVATMTGARSSSNTDELTQGDVEIYKSMLEEKPALPEFKVASASLSLGESIAINFKVNADVYTSYEDVYGIAECDGDVVRIEGVLGADGKYAFSYSNLTPKMAKVPVTFTLYGTSGGQSYTKTVEYSIYKYCTNQFSKTTDEAFKTLLTDFINYAAALQVYTDYNTGDLANADFDQTYASATLTDPASQLNLTYATVENPTVAWKGAGLAIQDTVNARLTFQAADITGLTIKFVINGVTYSVDTFTPVSGYTDRYYVYFGDILPREMRSAFTATAYVNDVAVSNTIQYSIQSYVVGKTDLGTNLSDLLVAMLKFGDACAAYFG